MKISSMSSGSVRTFVSVAVVAVVSFFFSALSVRAQVSTTSGNAIVTVALVDVMALVVTNPAVPITYTSTTDYQNGKTVPITAHLTVSSNRPYDVKVLADGNLTAATSSTIAGVSLGALGASASIPIGKVRVQATTAGGSTPQIALTTSAQTLIDNAPGAMVKAINVTYSTAANDPDFVGSGVYTATLTYSISAH